MKILACNSNRTLAEAVGNYLDLPLTKANIRRFADQEVFVEILENVRGEDMFVLQSTSFPANDHLMELLVSIDALRRSSARRITAVLPYYGYARQDRKSGPRTPISAKLVANLITQAGADRVVTIDLHAGQIQGFFNIPFDNLFASPVLLDYFKKQMPTLGETVVVSPDAGGVERARAFAKRLDATVAMIDKRRTGPNVAKAMNIVGDVEGKSAIILDDMIDTAGTLTEAATAVLDHGAVRVQAAATHGVLSGPAIDRIEASKIERIVVTDTIPLSERASQCKKITQLSVSDLLAEAIHRIHNYDSVSSLFV
jgi:ribose-phosphate pyrophosphokinase